MRDQRGMRCCPISERTASARDGVVDALRLALREGRRPRAAVPTSLCLPRIEASRTTAEQRASAVQRLPVTSIAWSYSVTRSSDVVGAATGSTRRAGLLLGRRGGRAARTPPGRWLFATPEPERLLAHGDAEFEVGRAEGRGFSRSTMGWCSRLRRSRPTGTCESLFVPRAHPAWAARWGERRVACLSPHGRAPRQRAGGRSTC